MAFGDALKRNIGQFRSASTSKKRSTDSFWIILRDCAVEDILEMYPYKVDSDMAVETYYMILCEHAGKIPRYFKQKLRSNGQERFRVINRNLWTSNAFHPDGLANQPGINAEKVINPARKGSKIIYQGVIENDCEL